VKEGKKKRHVQANGREVKKNPRRSSRSGGKEGYKGSVGRSGAENRGKISRLNGTKKHSQKIVSKNQGKKISASITQVGEENRFLRGGITKGAQPKSGKKWVRDKKNIGEVLKRGNSQSTNRQKRNN